jgi:hypothetical protein
MPVRLAATRARNRRCVYSGWSPKNVSGLKNTLAVNTDMERYAELKRSLKCGVLILAERKRLEAPNLLAYACCMMYWPSIKMVPHVRNMILDDSALRLGGRPLDYWLVCSIVTSKQLRATINARHG